MSDSPRARTLSLLRTLSSTAVKAGSEALARRMRAPRTPAGSAETPSHEKIGAAPPFAGEAGEIDGSDAEGFLPSQAALRFVQGLDELKGAAMKFGQLLSLEDNLLPPGWKPALAKLQAEATPKSWSAVEPILLESLGSLDAFASIEPTAVHAASIGQVHRGVLRDGTPVAVKVRYPALEKHVHSDLANIRRMLKVANLVPARGNFDDVFAAVEKVFLQELDFTKERAFYEEYGKRFQGSADYIVPRVVPDACARLVLTTHWVEGVNSGAWLARNAQEFSDAPQHALRDAVGTRVLGLLFTEMFAFRTIQTDPNPANFLIAPDGRIALLDFGATERLAPELVQNYWDLSMACLEGSKQDVVRVAKRMGLLQDEDSAAVVDSLVAMLAVSAEPFVHHSYSWRRGDLSRRLREEMMRFARAARMRPPPSEIVFLNRRILGTALFLERLGPTLNARALLYAHRELSPFHGSENFAST